MNIKEKLIEQLAVLENLQLLATNSGDFRVSLDTSGTILNYIRDINAINDEDEEHYTCADCEEAMAEEQLNQDIAKVSDLPIQIVKRVLAGQNEVLGIDD
jgi:hypothetical protein